MPWLIAFHDEFESEVEALDPVVRASLAAHARVLARFGPSLGRPLVDTLADSSFANMKELRFNAADGVWRVAFAFDPERTAILLAAGDKRGIAQDRFYRSLMDRADQRYARHLEALDAKNRR